MNTLCKVLSSLVAAVALASCAGTGTDKPHVYPEGDRPADPKPWNSPSNTFDNGTTGGMPQSR